MKTCDIELAVIGAGPAGMCAAIEAAKLGVETTIIDENNKPGGQLFKQIHKFFGSHRHNAGVRGFDIGMQLLHDMEAAEVNVLLDTVVFGYFGGNMLGLYRNGEVTPLRAQKTVIATGAMETPLSFKGWTLPGIMGAGAVQTMINVHGVLPGSRVLMVGSGNVGLIVSYQLMQAGAEVVGVVEALPRITGWHVHAAKIRRMGVPILLSHSIVEARGKDSVSSVVIAEVSKDFQTIRGTERSLEVDLVCIAVGLRPLTEMARLADCTIEYIEGLGGFVPLHNEYMQSSDDSIYVAGDITGIEEASTAMEEGKLAGVSVAYDLKKLHHDTFAMMAGVINTNLMELRLGSFGVGRRRCKEALLEKYNEKMKV
jgi:NADPH-dependent 2,4-dienoyl-CoA reductase/sulfur reductase-like enzyme